MFPPLLPVLHPPTEDAGTFHGSMLLHKELESIKSSADVVLVANVKSPGLLKTDTVHAAIEIQEKLHRPTAAAVVVRDQNRAQFDTAVFTAASAGLDSLFLAWGDDYPPSSGITNVRDFSSLADAIRRASVIRSKARAKTRIFAPVDVGSLAKPKGVALAKGRLRAGADLLLAQPPTTDPAETFDAHASLVGKAGLKDKVLLSVFPFRDLNDIKRYEELFGWKLPNRIHQEASKGETRLDQLARGVVQRLGTEAFPGVYLVARGNPGIASHLLA